MTAPREARSDRGATIVILHIPGCPLLVRLRDVVHDALARGGVRAVVEEIERPCASPTLLINGTDVTGRPPAAQPCCRLDIPTAQQILAALARPGPGPGSLPSPAAPGQP